MIGLAQGLKYSFEQGVTHRDIKGTNILISNTGVAKLVDFGLATIEGDENKSGVKSQRTVDYSALERTCKSPKGDPRSDIYFLGCVFYQMVTGQLPMEESESKDMLKKMLVRSFGAIKPIGEHPYAPDEELAAIIEKMMKIDLKARYQTMDEVVNDLEQYEASLEAAEDLPADAAQRAQAAEDEFDSIFGPPPEPSLDEDEAAAEVASGSLPFEVKAVVLKSVLCVEAQDEIQDVLRKTLDKMGYRVLLVRDAEVAAERYRESPTDAVIFDTDGQGPEAIDALIDMHDKAQEDEHQLVALVLLGPRQGDLKEKLPTERQDHRALQAAQDEGRPGIDPSAPARSMSERPNWPAARTTVMLAKGPTPWLMLALGLAGAVLAAGSGPDRPAPEDRAVGFLAREVPRWSRENHCYSCHNNGDAARALYEAARAGYRVPAEALADTTGWLTRPAGWDHNGGDGPFSDKRLARLVFTITLAAAVRTGRVSDRAALLRAAERMAVDQAADGSWIFDGEETPGSPAAYGRVLATFLARDSLAAAQPDRFRAAIDRADGWLLRREVATVTDASVSLMAAAVLGSPATVERRRLALDLLRRGQDDEGGWGPYVTSPPEPFDTALVLLALAKSGDSDQVRRMIARGRAFLIAHQHDDGSWTETTRPPGAESYAQRISTTGWATLALLATRDVKPRLPIEK